MTHPSHTGSTVALAGAFLSVAEPAEQALRAIGGASIDDLKWAVNVAVGIAATATGVYLHCMERRERAKIHRQQLEDEARRGKALLDMESRIKLAQLARDGGLLPDPTPDRQAAGLPTT